MNSISLLSTFCNRTSRSGTHLSLGTKEMATYLQGRSSACFFKIKRSSEKNNLQEISVHIFSTLIFLLPVCYNIL